MNYANSSVSFRRRSRRSRARKRRAVTIVVLLALMAGVLLVAHAHSASRTVASAILPSAPAIGRAAPHSLPVAWSNDDRNRLRDELESAFAPALAGARGWSLAVAGGDGNVVFDDRAHDSVAPASVQKLIVACTALDALGPAYRFQTLFAGPQGIANDGSLDGDLWLVGSGDPSLTSDDIRDGIALLARSGLRRVQGALVVDATALRGPGLNPHWAPDDDGQDYAAPTSAISVDGDTVESSQDVDGVEQRFYTPMTDVPAYVAGRVNAMLARRGIQSASRPAVGAAPLESVVLWDHRSAPLTALEGHMLFVSDNHYAEQLLRAVGGAALDEPDDAGGITAEREYLSRLGIPVPGLQLFDGSGLSPQNRVAAVTFARLLLAQEPLLYALLPRGGRDGTLEDYDFTSALGRVRAKSGHISGVSSLAGYVATAHHGRVTFAFLIDGSPGDPDAAIVRAVDRLAEF